MTSKWCRRRSLLNFRTETGFLPRSFQGPEGAVRSSPGLRWREVRMLKAAVPVLMSPGVKGELDRKCFAPVRGAGLCPPCA